MIRYLNTCHGSARFAAIPSYMSSTIQSPSCSIACKSVCTSSPSRVDLCFTFVCRWKIRSPFALQTNKRTIYFTSAYNEVTNENSGDSLTNVIANADSTSAFEESFYHWALRVGWSTHGSGWQCPRQAYRPRCNNYIAPATIGLGLPTAFIAHYTTQLASYYSKFCSD